jgi:hypothetical protein
MDVGPLWQVELQPGALLLRTQTPYQRPPTRLSGRELVQAVGAALFNARVSLAADGWAAEVERWLDPVDRTLVAVVRPAQHAPDACVAALAAAIARRHSDGHGTTAHRLPEELLAGLVASASAEGAVLVPIVSGVHRHLVARLTHQADPTSTMALLATRSDDVTDWLRCGEAMQRVLLELAARGWSATPLSQPVEVPLTRMQLRSALSWDAHPQLLLSIGRATSTAAPR